MRYLFRVRPTDPVVRFFHRVESAILFRSCLVCHFIRGGFRVPSRGRLRRGGFIGSRSIVFDSYQISAFARFRYHAREIFIWHFLSSGLREQLCTAGGNNLWRAPIPLRSLSRREP